MAAVSLTVNGKSVTADVDPRTLLVQLLRENLAAHRHACRLRHLAMRRLRRPCQRQGREILHRAGVAARWRRRAHHRGAGARRRPAASDAGSLPRESRTAMRLLHAGHDHDRVDMVRRKGHELDDHTIREELEGNICRCTGYHNIVKAIAAGARAMKGAGASRRRPSRAPPTEVRHVTKTEQ